MLTRNPKAAPTIAKHQSNPTLAVMGICHLSTTTAQPTIHTRKEPINILMVTVWGRDVDAAGRANSTPPLISQSDGLVYSNKTGE